MIVEKGIPDKKNTPPPHRRRNKQDTPPHDTHDNKDGVPGSTKGSKALVMGKQGVVKGFLGEEGSMNDDDDEDDID
jgi:hypothetical protein